MRGVRNRHIEEAGHAALEYAIDALRVAGLRDTAPETFASDVLEGIAQQLEAVASAGMQLEEHPKDEKVAAQAQAEIATAILRMAGAAMALLAVARSESEERIQAPPRKGVVN